MQILYATRLDCFFVDALLFTTLEDAFNLWKNNYDFYNGIIAAVIDDKITYAIINAARILHTSRQNKNDICCTIIYYPKKSKLRII